MVNTEIDAALKLLVCGNPELSTFSCGNFHLWERTIKGCQSAGTLYNSKVTNYPCNAYRGEKAYIIIHRKLSLLNILILPITRNLFSLINIFLIFRQNKLDWLMISDEAHFHMNSYKIFDIGQLRIHKWWKKNNYIHCNHLVRHNARSR